MLLAGNVGFVLFPSQSRNWAVPFDFVMKPTHCSTGNFVGSPQRCSVLIIMMALFDFSGQVQEYLAQSPSQLNQILDLFFDEREEYPPSIWTTVVIAIGV